jgi:hypothetical protein
MYLKEVSRILYNTQYSRIRNGDDQLQPTLSWAAVDVNMKVTISSRDNVHSSGIVENAKREQCFRWNRGKVFQTS